MDFDFSPDQIAFHEQVEKFLDENDDPIVFDPIPDVRRATPLDHRLTVDLPHSRTQAATVSVVRPFPLAGLWITGSRSGIEGRARARGADLR